MKSSNILILMICVSILFSASSFAMTKTLTTTIYVVVKSQPDIDMIMNTQKLTEIEQMSRIASESSMTRPFITKVNVNELRTMYTVADKL